MAENTQNVFASKYEQHQKDRGYKGICRRSWYLYGKKPQTDLLLLNLQISPMNLTKKDLL